MKRSKRFGSMKRNVTSPVPTLGFTATECRTNKIRFATQEQRSSHSRTTPSTADTLRPQWTSLSLSLPPPSRRGSWQPSRRSVQELEADCHDSDDELPEEASLWNVPVSPHPNGIRSHRTSFIGSPSRDPRRPRPQSQSRWNMRRLRPIHLLGRAKHLRLCPGSGLSHTGQQP